MQIVAQGAQDKYLTVDPEMTPDVRYEVVIRVTAAYDVMELNLEGDLLHRSRDYFGPGAHASRLSMVDGDTLVLHTSYDGLSFREEIRYVKNDYALRQTIGFSDKTGEAALVGQYHEQRI